MARKSAPMPDALTLWTHPGDLAATMRAAKAKMTPAAFAAASADTLLQVLGDVEVHLEADVRVYTQRGVVIATLELLDDSLVLQFSAPVRHDDFADVADHYTEVPSRPGWLEFRRPATRDPKPGLAARLGAVVGRANLDRRAASVE